MYRVITRFCDLQDGNHIYQPGDTFPRAGMEAFVTDSRIEELSSNRNRRKTPLIAQEAEKPPKRRRRGKENDADGSMSRNTKLV